ncbi:MAG: type II toxin-antitoxin system HicA family toxin [Spirochaetia bacterium]
MAPALDNTANKLYNDGVTRKELVKMLEKNGWELDRIKGSHHIMVREGSAPLSVPVHGKEDLKKGILNKLMKQGGLK